MRPSRAARIAQFPAEIRARGARGADAAMAFILLSGPDVPAARARTFHDRGEE
jgi:hypothetical protein